jgi:threonine dehydrogenase-like Zn-dependent dehydrogenase
MKAVCYRGNYNLQVEQVRDPEILRPTDAILKVTMSATCGSDLHLVSGLIPSVKRGDIIGHEFMGEVIETGPQVKKLRKGQRVVVGSVIACGACYFCKHEMWSLCDNSNPNEMLEETLGYVPAGIYGYSHVMGGYAGSHAEYIRLPYADWGAFEVPEDVTDEQAVFISDAVPTGFMAADNCNIQKGDIVAVWGCGGVGLMAMASARILGAEEIIAIDGLPNRLQIAQEKVGAETINFNETDVPDALREMTGGRGPDSCIDAVGMEAVGPTMLTDTYDRVKQTLRLESDRSGVLRQAIVACRKGGTFSIPGVYVGWVDKFPMGALMNKALTIRTGQQYGQKYIPRLLKLTREKKLDPSFLVTHRAGLAGVPKAYETFRSRADGILRAVFTPHRELPA